VVKLTSLEGMQGDKSVQLHKSVSYLARETWRENCACPLSEFLGNRWGRISKEFQQASCLCICE